MSVTLDPITGAEMEVDITGQPIKRDVMGNIIDPVTGLPKDPLTGHAKEPHAPENAKDTPAAGKVQAPGEPLDPTHPHATQHHVVDASLNRLDDLSKALPHDGAGMVVQEIINKEKLSNPSAAAVSQTLAMVADYEHVPGLSGMPEKTHMIDLDTIPGLGTAKHLVLDTQNLPPDFDPRNIREAEITGAARENVKRFKDMNLHKEKTQGQDLPPLSSKGALV